MNWFEQTGESDWRHTILLCCLAQLVGPRPAHISVMIFFGMRLGIPLCRFFVGATLGAEPAFQAVQTMSADGEIGFVFWAGGSVRVIA